MALQLVYTSNPVSLTVGRSGFSTVARCENMSDKLVAQVEKCGIFDSIKFPIYSHRIVEANGKRWHVLSRVCDSGVDYTNRNNYLAHHLVISQDEIASLGVSADILLNWNGWLDSWNREPTYLPEVDLSKVPRTSSVPAQNWKMMFQDAGYASVLGTSSSLIRAEAYDSKKLLELFGESLSLFVNSVDSWECTYTTRFCDGANPMDYLWKVVNAPSFEQSIAVDIISKKCVPISEGRASSYARSGKMTNVEKYNLSVKKPVKIQRRFQVVQGQTEKKTFSWLPVISFIVSALVLAIFAWGYLGMSRAEDEEILSESGLQKLQSSTASEKSLESMKSDNLVEIKKKISNLLTNGDCLEALALWESSEWSENDPKYRLQILRQSGNIADEYIFSAEKALENNNYSAAKRALNIARKALESPEIPRRLERIEKLNILTGKIK